MKMSATPQGIPFPSPSLPSTWRNPAQGVGTSPLCGEPALNGLPQAWVTRGE